MMESNAKVGTGKSRPAVGRRWRSVLLFAAGCLTGVAGLAVSDVLLGRLLGYTEDDAHLWQFQRALYAYLTNEGHAARGEQFQHCMGLLSVIVQGGRDVSEAQLLAYAGPPDLTKEEGELHYYGFRYNRPIEKDWVVYVTVQSGKVQGGVGFGPAPADGSSPVEGKAPQPSRLGQQTRRRENGSP